MELLGEGGEKGGQGQDESAQDGREPSGFSPAQGDDQRRPQPAAAQLNHADPHCTWRAQLNKKIESLNCE